MLGEAEKDRTALDLNFASSAGRGKESFLVPLQSLKGPLSRAWDPTFAEGLNKSRRLSQPGRDGLSPRSAAGAVAKGEPNREVVSEGGPPTVRLVGWWGTSTTGSKRGCVHTVAGAKNLSRREDQE